MHYKNGRPAKAGDWVIGPTHNSKGGIRVGYVVALMPDGGACNVKLAVWLGKYDFCGGEGTWKGPDKNFADDDYAYTANLHHVLDGFYLADVVANALQWDSPDDLRPKLNQ